jgi:hypothetical protein
MRMARLAQLGFLSLAVRRKGLAARGCSWLHTVTRSCSMLRASLGATTAGLATCGCLNRPVGQNKLPWFRAVELCLHAVAHVSSWLLAAARSLSQARIDKAPLSLGQMDKQLPRATAWPPRLSTCMTPRASAWVPRLSSVPSVYAWIPSFLFVFVNKIHTNLHFLLLRQLKIIVLNF